MKKIVALFASALILAGCDTGQSPTQNVERDQHEGPGIGFTYNGKPGIQFDPNIPIVVPFDGTSPGMGWSP